MKYFIIHTILAILLFNCSGLKKLPEGEKLYTGAKIRVNTKKEDRAARIKEKLITIPEPKPNVKFLGMRPFLWLHNQIKEPKKEKGFKYWLKYKIGNPPVLMSMVEPERTAVQLGNSLYNDGYFKHKVDYDIKTKEGSKTASITYTAQPGVQFMIKEVSYPRDSIDIEHLDLIRDGSLLKAGQNYSLERIEKERLRIEQVLKDSGYYYFDHSFIIFLADSTVGNHEVDLIAVLSDQTPDKAKVKYRIDEISVLVSSGLLNQNDSLNKTQSTEPSKVNGIAYYDAENRYRPEAIVRYVELEEDQVYHKINYQQSVRQLLSLQNFNYVDMNFPESDKPGYLNAKVNLITRPMKSIRLEIQATSESNNFVGSAVTTTFMNRNIFRGAEIFNLSLTTGFETQVSGQQQNALNSYEISLRSSVKFPRLISPIVLKDVKNKYVPHTTIGLGVETIRRNNFYSFNSAEINFGYEWIQSETVRHELFPVVLRLTQLTSVSEEFREILDQNPLLRESYEEQFIVGSRYNFFINTRSLEGNIKKTNNFFLNFSVEASGNLLNLIQNSIGDKGEDDYYSIFGSRYSQFLRTSIDGRHYLRITENHRFATRLILGVGYAYGNSDALPVSRQFAIGGSSSIRAFRARSIGPGRFSQADTNPNGLLIDQTADLKVEGNFEYRHTIAGQLEGAIFLDAGNIWTLGTDPNRPGAEFSTDTFFGDLAVGTGYGIRFDANFFILRLDLAFPLRVPNIENDSRWVVKDIAVNEREWRRNNLVWNIALGYPF